jgi:hypothetical protein
LCSQILIIIGLFLSLLGTYVLYKSIFPRGPLYGKDGSNIAFPNAVVNINVARIGFICIFIGIIFQIIAIAISLFITI